MSNAFNNFGKASPAVFNNSGRPITAMPGLGLGHDLAAAATAGKQNPNPASKLKTPTSVPATAEGIQAAQNTKVAKLLAVLTKNAQGGAPVPGPAGIPPAPNSAAVVQPPPPGPVPPPAAAPSPIPANPRQQPPRERTPEDDRQAAVLDGILSEGQEARQIPDRSPTRELESDLMTRGKLANDSISAFSKFAQLYKKSRQDNSKPSRSAMGESNGLSYEHRKEDHATGTDAWSSLDRFRRKESGDQSFSAAFVDECVSRGMSVDQIADAIVKVGHDFGEDVAATLIGDLEKQAINWSAFGKIFNWGSKAAPAAAKVTGVAPEATQAARAVTSIPRRQVTRPTSGYYNPSVENAAPAVTQAANAIPEAAQTATSAFKLPNIKLPNIGGLGMRGALGVSGGTAGYSSVDEDEPWYEKLKYTAMGASAGLMPSFAKRNANFGSHAWRLPARIGIGVASGAAAGGGIGKGFDIVRNKIEETDPEDKNFYRNAGRYIGGTAGGFGSLLPIPYGGGTALAAVPSWLLYESKTPRSTVTQLSDPIARRSGRVATRGAKEELFKNIPQEFVSYNPETKEPYFDLEKAKNYGYETAGGFVDDYISRKLGGIDDYVQQYTNPLFQAMGMDVSKMPAWQRYAMLGGGLMTGAGALMQNPYMMGFGGLLGAGAGMYPTLAGMANPYVRKQFGFDLPGANPYYSSAASQPPASPPQ